MFVERIDGDWMDHPFWRAGFVIAKATDLLKLQNSVVPSVVIDESRGVAAERIAAANPARPGSSNPPKLSGQSNVARRRPLQAAARTSEALRLNRKVHVWRRAVKDLFLDVQSGKAMRPEACREVVDQISASLAENPKALIRLTRLKSMDNYTFLHSVSVSALLMHLYRHLGREEAEIQEIGLAGLFHDIGKLTVKPSILGKIAPLTDAEREVIRSHPERGRDILERSPDPSQILLDVCLHHHERMDGTGYPMALAGEEISFHARAAAICDVFDALTSVRPYKAAWTPGAALSKMRSWTGAFDPDLLEVFATSMELSVDEVESPAPSDTSSFSINGYSDPSAA